MPTIAHQNDNLRKNGPILNVTATISRAAEAAYTKAGLSIPRALRLTALVDTGASMTVIKTGISETLGLNPVGSRPINTASSENLACPVYLIRLDLGKSVIREVFAVEVPLRGHTLECLIGRDILQHCTFVYDGDTNQYLLSF